MFDLDNYINNLEKIGGWCNPLTAKAINFIGNTQNSFGDVVEIGIHHGKSFMPLAATVKEGESAIAIDVFEDQHLNIDNSGKGSREILESNILKYIGKNDNIKIIKADSTTLTKERFINPVRLMSIDGGHTKAITYSDLRLANDVCDNEDAIVFLDDFLNPDWLGVLSGYIVYSQEYYDSFIPVAFFPNKIVLSRSKSALKYRELLRNAFSDNLSKCYVPFMDYEIDIYK